MNPASVTITVAGVPVVIALRPKSKDQPIIRADFTLPISGGRRRYSTGTDDPKRALRELDRLMPAITADIRRDLAAATAAGHPGGPGEDPHIGDLADWYTKTHLPYSGAKPRTIQKAAQVLRDFELYCRAHNIGRMSQVNMGRIQEFCIWKDQETRRTMAPKTKHVHVALLRAWLLAAVDAGKLQESPVRKWLMPALPRTDVAALSRPEVLALLDAVRKHEPESWAPVAFLANTGWSVTDAVTLTTDQLRGDRIIRQRTKTGVRLDVPLVGPVLEAVQAARPDLITGGPGASRKDTNTQNLNPSRRKMNATPGKTVVNPEKTNAAGGTRHIFTRGGTKTPHSERTLLRAVQRAARAEGLQFTPTLKLLRASYGTWLAESGASPKVLAGLMGHADINMTLRYYIGVDFDRTAQFLRTLFQSEGSK